MIIFAIIGVLVVSICVGIILGCTLDDGIDYMFNLKEKREEKLAAERKAYEDEIKQKVEMNYGF